MTVDNAHLKGRTVYMTVPTAFDSFITKVKGDVSAWLTLDALAEYVKNEGSRLYLAVHGNHAFVKLDVSVSTFMLQQADDELKDVELNCSLADGRCLTLNGSLFDPSVDMNGRPTNYSRMFIDQDQRDAYFDNMCYFFEIEEEKYLAARRKHEEQFIKWFFQRFSGGKE